MYSNKEEEASQSSPRSQPQAHGFHGVYGSFEILPPEQDEGLSSLVSKTFTHQASQTDLSQGPAEGQPVRVSYTSGNVEVVMLPPQRVIVQPFDRPPSYRMLSLFSLFMCFPIVLCAIMYSINSNSAANVGNMARAKSEGHHARNLSIGAIVLGIIVIILIVVNLMYTVHRYS